MWTRVQLVLVQRQNINPVTECHSKSSDTNNTKSQDNVTSDESYGLFYVVVHTDFTVGYPGLSLSCDDKTSLPPHPLTLQLKTVWPLKGSVLGLPAAVTEKVTALHLQP